MPTYDLLIYGAYGYTGELIAQEAQRKGLSMLLAGRDAAKTQAIAQKLECDYRAFALEDQEALYEALGQVKVVLHCAGPFALTAAPMIAACLACKKHYLDITGEIEIFEYAASLHQAAEAAGIALMPGVGFDVVPSDCLAAFLKKELPGATHLELAFMGLGGISRGTALTMARNAHKGGAIRKEGRIVPVKAAYEVKEIDYGMEKALSVTIPWGDVSTAYYSTGIPNIKVFMAQSPQNIRAMQWSNYLGWLLGTSFMQKRMQKKIAARVKGPSEAKRESNRSFLWGEVQDGTHKVAAWLITPEGYKLTAITAVLAAQKVLQGKFRSGFNTPSMAFGADFILEVPGTERHLF
jgi:short subunit dehydrogenase-like uncharacterized protein